MSKEKSVFSQNELKKLVDKAIIEKFSPAIFFKLCITIPEELPSEIPEHSDRETERRGIAKNWALWKLRRTKEFKEIARGFGEAAVTRKKYGGAYEVIVVYRWG